MPIKDAPLPRLVRFAVSLDSRRIRSFHRETQLTRYSMSKKATGKSRSFQSKARTLLSQFLDRKNSSAKHALQDRRGAVDSTIVRSERPAIVRLINQEPASSGMFIAHLLSRTIRIEADLVEQLLDFSDKRLARLLLLLATFGKDGTPETIITKINQEMLAEVIGALRSRACYFMSKFRQLRFIDHNGTLSTVPY